MLYAPHSDYTTPTDLPSITVDCGPSKSPTVPCIEIRDSIDVPDDVDKVYLSGNGLGSCNYLVGTYYNLNIPCQIVTSFPSCLTHLYLDGCRFTCLEKFAHFCPGLIQLSLFGCGHVLEKLQGLAAIAAHCPRLENLSLGGIFQVECLNLLWEILGRMHLSRLVIDVSMLGSRADQRGDDSASHVSVSTPLVTIQALRVMARLTALDLRGNRDGVGCKGCMSEDGPIIFSSLEYLRCSLFPDGVHDHLKYLTLPL